MVILFHGQIVPGQIVPGQIVPGQIVPSQINPLNSQIIPQNSFIFSNV